MGPKTVQIAVSNANDILRNTFKEKGFGHDGAYASFDWRVKAVKIVVFKGGFAIGEYISTYTDLFWELTRSFAIKAIKELNRCLKDPKKESLTA